VRPEYKATLLLTQPVRRYFLYYVYLCVPMYVHNLLKFLSGDQRMRRTAALATRLVDTSAQTEAPAHFPPLSVRRQPNGWSRCGHYRHAVTSSLFGGTEHIPRTACKSVVSFSTTYCARLKCCINNSNGERNSTESSSETLVFIGTVRECACQAPDPLI
jgi:hypothetical protein